MMASIKRPGKIHRIKMIFELRSTISATHCVAVWRRGFTSTAVSRKSRRKNKATALNSDTPVDKLEPQAKLEDVLKSDKPAEETPDVPTIPKPIKKRTVDDKNFTVVAKGFFDRAKSVPEHIMPNDQEIQVRIPRLKHGLERVLFNPGVHFLRDPRTSVYNYDPYLRFLTQVDEFNYDIVKSFTPPSADTKLAEIASTQQSKFTGSTSSVSSVLGQIYTFVSNKKGVSLASLPRDFAELPNNFTAMASSPTMVEIKPTGTGLYSIDKYEPNGMETVLSLMGTSIEYFFTQDQEQYKVLLKRNETPPSTPPDLGQDLYAYCKYGSLLLRSQLDCYNPHLPRKWFDIKSRATAAIRHNVLDYRSFVDYRLNNQSGRYNSFAGELYDMMRSAFLKYSFQVRIGNMDGLFIAFHNTDEIFGFQYVSREDLDEILFGSTSAANQMFGLSLKLMETVSEEIVKEWPETRIRLLFNMKSDSLEVFAEKIEAECQSAVTEKQENVMLWKLKVQSFLNGVECPGFPQTIHPRDDLMFKYTLLKGTGEYLEDYQTRRTRMEIREATRLTKRPNHLYSRYFSSQDDTPPILYELK